jgi:hypothetical protein
MSSHVGNVSADTIGCTDSSSVAKVSTTCPSINQRHKSAILHVTAAILLKCVWKCFYFFYYGTSAMLSLATLLSHHHGRNPNLAARIGFCSRVALGLFR